MEKNKSKPGIKEFEEIIDIFKSRDSADYLRVLSENLKIKNLTDSAIVQPKSSTNKANAEKKFTKCIKIYFCGLNASTLLNSDRNRRTNENANWLKEINKQFRELCSPSSIKSLNEEGIYLKIRFLFQNPYSDFFRALINAENRMETFVDQQNTTNHRFIQLPPIRDSEFKGDLYDSQITALKEIAQILQDSEGWLDLESPPELTDNTLHVRFAAVPLTLCMLRVNKNVYFDPYIYARKSYPKQLSRFVPLSNAKYFEEEDETTFNYVKNNFDYCWAHDLTQFATDFTEYSKKKPHGLKLLIPPASESNISWKNKGNYIIERINHNPKNSRAKKSLKDESLWKSFSTIKLIDCVRVPGDKDILPQSPITDSRFPFSDILDIRPSAKCITSLNFDSSSSFLIIGCDEGRFCFDLFLKGNNFMKESNAMIPFDDRKLLKPFAFLLHYAFAKRGDKQTALHRKIADYVSSTIPNAIINMLFNISSLKGLDIDSLFKHHNKGKNDEYYELKISANRIHIFNEAHFNEDLDAFYYLKKGIKKDRTDTKNEKAHLFNDLLKSNYFDPNI